MASFNICKVLKSDDEECVHVIEVQYAPDWTKMSQSRASRYLGNNSLMLSSNNTMHSNGKPWKESMHRLHTFI